MNNFQINMSFLLYHNRHKNMLPIVVPRALPRAKVIGQEGFVQGRGRGQHPLLYEIVNQCFEPTPQQKNYESYLLNSIQNIRMRNNAEVVENGGDSFEFRRANLGKFDQRSVKEIWGTTKEPRKEMAQAFKNNDQAAKFEDGIWSVTSEPKIEMAQVFNNNDQGKYEGDNIGIPPEYDNDNFGILPVCEDGKIRHLPPGKIVLSFYVAVKMTPRPVSSDHIMQALRAVRNNQKTDITYIRTTNLRHPVPRSVDYNPDGLFCRFCQVNDEPDYIVYGHELKTKNIYGKTITACPVLRKFVCKYCGQTGDDAHTITHCPKLLSEEGKLVSIAQKIKETRRDSTGRERKRSGSYGFVPRR